VCDQVLGRARPAPAASAAPVKLETVSAFEPAESSSVSLAR
jgi:hypothetical protein